MPASIDKELVALQPEHFGPLEPFVTDPEITDVDYNGYMLLVRDKYGTRRNVDIEFTESDFNMLVQHIQNSVGKEFNRTHPLLEAESEQYRLSVVHSSVNGGKDAERKSICIRKTPPRVAIETRESIENGYMKKDVISLLMNLIKCHANFIICGTPGTGKTELAKYLGMAIDPLERVITIEDSREWRYHDLKPDADCVELQVTPSFDYFAAIKCCLRQNPDWICVSEIRGLESENYIQQLSTGCHGITTLHTDSVKNIPNRIANMGTPNPAKMIKDVYTFVNVGILIDIRVQPDGSKKRRIAEVGLFSPPEHGASEGTCTLIVEDGKLIVPPDEILDMLPEAVKTRFRDRKVENPLYYKDIDDACVGLYFSPFTGDVVSKLDYDKEVKEFEKQKKEAEEVADAEQSEDDSTQQAQPQTTSAQQTRGTEDMRVVTKPTASSPTQPNRPQPLSTSMPKPLTSQKPKPVKDMRSGRRLY